METRGNFGSKLGVILPQPARQSVWVMCGVSLIWQVRMVAPPSFSSIWYVLSCSALPGMMSEFIIGRHSASNAARAYSNLGKHKAWVLWA